MMCVLFLTGAVSLCAQGPVTREATMKSVFLFNFTQFIEWPSTAFTTQSAPFVIGIVGDDPFGVHIDETVEGEKVGTHPLTVQRYRDIRDVKNCHILFINTKEIDKDALISLAGRNILTVSDAKNFIKIGGMVRFSTENNKIKLDINADAAKAENLVISSKLLRIATRAEMNR